MDLVSGFASISQLIAYGQGVTKGLIRLYKAIQNGPALFQDQKFNVRFLLKVTERICRRNSSADESLLLLFIQITTSASSIVGLLEQRGILGINWTPHFKSETLAAAFESLHRKGELLQLHLSQESYELLNHIQIGLVAVDSKLSGIHFTAEEGMAEKDYKSNGKDLGQVTSEDPKSTALPLKESQTTQKVAPPGYPKIKATENAATENSEQVIANGWGKFLAKSGVVDLDASNNKATQSTQNIANYD